MKKAFLVILVITAVVFSSFAGGLHYGFESAVDYEFNLSETYPGDNKATFAFKPYVYNDFFTVRLLAEWRPDGTNAHGFDYLFNFDTTDLYSILASSLKYVDEISVNTGVVEFAVGKGTRDFEIYYQWASQHQNRAQLKLNVGPVKAEFYATDFVTIPFAVGYDDYESLQYANVKVNLGLVEIEAEATRQAYYWETNNPGLFVKEGKNRIIPKVGAKLQFGLANVGFYFTTDLSYNMDDTVLNKLFDRWVLEALAEFKVGAYNLTGKFYLDNRLEGYSDLYFPDEALFGFRVSSKLNVNDFLTLDLYGDLPLKLDGALRVVRRSYDNKTMETVKASVEFGTWWKVGAEFELKGLISHIENGDDFMKILNDAQPTITAGIYTVPLDVTASVKLSSTFGSEFVPIVTVGAVIRADNFLSNIDK